MAIHIQRKRFDHPQLAHDAAAGFRDPTFKLPFVTVSAEAREIEGQYWVYVVQEGDMVNGEEPLLPDYERVS